MGAVAAGGRIEVDPEVLLRAGQRMGSIGAQLDALSTSLGTALGSGVASGWDPAGLHFGLTYGDDAQKFATTLAEAANAFKFSGQRLAASGYNYKNADAGSTIGGSTPMGSVGDAPSETKAVDAPTGPSGATVPPPPNWWLIDGLLNAIPFIGPVAGAVMTWPQGNPSLMRLTAAQWHNFATGLAAFNDDVPALKTAVSQEHIPEQPKIQECLGQLGEYLPYLANLAKTIGDNVDDFANGVQRAQDAIRRLLDRISPEGLWDTVTGFLTGEGDDILRQVADDVGAVLENFQQEVKGIVGLLSDLSKALGEALDAFQKWVKPALEATFGDQVGGALADAVTFYTDVQLGLINGVIGTVSGVVSLADVDVLKGMAEMALSVAEDPTKLPGVLENMGKQFIAYDQLTGDHPGRGVGEAAFNIGTLFLPGAAASKTGSIARGLRYGSKLLDEGRLPRISDIPGMGGGRSLPSVDDLPGAGPGRPGAPEFTPPQLPESLANPPSAPHAPEAPRTPQELGGSGGPPGGGGPPDPPGGRPVGPPDSGPGRADGPAPQSPSSGAGEPSRVSEPTAPSAQTPPAAPSHAPASGDSPAPAAPHAPESPSSASPYETGGQSPSEPSPSPTEHSPATPEPHANGAAEPRADGNYAPNENYQPASEGHTGGTADGTHAPADHQPAAHTPTTESPGTHEPTRTDNGQPHEPTRAPGDAADARPHEPAATTPAAPMAGGMPMAPHTGGGVHSPSDAPASRAPSPEPPARTPESRAPQASSPESPRTTTPASAGPGPSSTPSAPVSPTAGHPSSSEASRVGEPSSSARPASDAPEARPRQPSSEARRPEQSSHQELPEPAHTPRSEPPFPADRATTEPGPADGASPSDHDPKVAGEDLSPSLDGDHDAPLFDESGAGYPESYPLPPESALTSPRDGAFFWSGRDAEGVGIGPESAGGDGRADQIAASHNGTTLEGLLERNGIDPPKWSPEDPAAQQWWSDVSDMYAANVSGEVRAVVGSDLRPGNVWETVELPRLLENPNVTRITQIDAETGHATEIFSRQPATESGPSHDRPSPLSGGDDRVELPTYADTHDSARAQSEPSRPPTSDTPTVPAASGNEHAPEGSATDSSSERQDAPRADSPEHPERSDRHTPAADPSDTGGHSYGPDRLAHATEPTPPASTYNSDLAPSQSTTPPTNDTPTRQAASGNEYAPNHREPNASDAPSERHEAPRADSSEHSERSDRHTPATDPRDAGGSSNGPDRPAHVPEPLTPAPEDTAPHSPSDGHSGDRQTGADNFPHTEAEPQHRAGSTDTEPKNIPPDEISPPLIREHPYPHTGGIRPEYVGEQFAGGPLGSPGVTYLDEAAREGYRVTIRDGLVYDANGRPFDTSNGISAFGPGHNGRAIFVMDEHGNIYASTFQKFREFHHSSLLAGGDVASAGEIVVKNGRIELISDCSGHYRPGRARTKQLLDQLESQGITVDPSHVDLTAPAWTA